MHRLIRAVAAATLLLALSATSALAAPLHQHYVTTPGSAEPVPIALGICKNELQQPLDNLHANVHFGAPGAAFATNPITLTTVLPCP